MRCSIWLTACLAIACGQSLAVEKNLTINNQAPSASTEIPDSLASKHDSSNATVLNHGHEQVEHTIRSQLEHNEGETNKELTEESESQESKGSEHESTETTSEDDTENVSENQSNEGNSKPQSPENSDSQEDLTLEESGVASESIDTSSDDHSSDSESESDAIDEGNSDNDILLKETTNGPVKGYKWDETDIYAFIDIPYGKIEKPFEAPESAQNWTEVHEVKEHNARCPQFHDKYMGDLDCLTLTIFVPAEIENAGVLFYVHDSSFHSGDPMIYGPEHLVSKGVILVLPNYRIGALGFLCLQNETAPGNAGLKDLSLALEWIKSNIENFGGNKSNIVVGGHGDAGALVGYLALSSPSKSNIHKVITESGSLLSPLAFDRNPVLKATQLANIIRDDESYENEYQNMFAETSVRKIVAAAKDLKFNPCIERGNEPFMSVSPWALLQNEEIDVAFMIGFASYAGTHEAIAVSESFIEELNKNPVLFLPQDLLFSTTEERNEQASRIKSQYFNETEIITLSQVTELSLLSTDALYLGPLVRSARPLVEAGAAVYLYEFEFVGELNRELISLKNPVKGAVRSDIIGYLFSQNGKQIDEATREAAMIRLMVDLWVSFINNGSPTAENIEWNKMKAGEDSEEEFLKISSDCELEKGVHLDRLRLWTELYNEYFIDRSFAFSLTPGYYISITIIFWVTYTKLDYH